VKIILLLLILLTPSVAFSQSIYDVSCSNVAKTTIYRLRASDWLIKSYSGSFYLLALDLKPHAGQAFGKLLKSISTAELKYNDVKVQAKALIITANGEPLRSDIPAMNGFSEQGILIPFFLKEDAFDTARSVCPAVPIEFIPPPSLLLDGQAE